MLMGKRLHCFLAHFFLKSKVLTSCRARFIYCFTLYQDTALSFLRSRCPFPWPAVFIRGCRSESRALAGFCNGLASWECPRGCGSADRQGYCLWGDVYSMTHLRLVPFLCTAFIVKRLSIFGDFAVLVKSHLCRKWKSPCFLSLIGKDSNCHLSGGHSHGVTRAL